MRIIAGRWRGKVLKAAVREATRPTSDRAREALFSIVESRLARAGKAWADVAMADVFAGTGAVGLEALSRGARRAYFFEKDLDVLKGLRANLTACGVGGLHPLPTSPLKGEEKEAGEGIVVAGDALRVGRAREACDFVFLDPPYGSGLGAKALVALEKGGWIKDDAIVVVEVEKKEAIEAAGFDVVEERAYGIAKFVFLSKRVLGKRRNAGA